MENSQKIAKTASLAFDPGAIVVPQAYNPSLCPVSPFDPDDPHYAKFLGARCKVVNEWDIPDYSGAGPYGKLYHVCEITLDNFDGDSIMWYPPALKLAFGGGIS